MPNAPVSIVGKPSGYTAAEYPKVVYDKDGKTLLARNPDHLSELVKSGWTEDYTDAVVKNVGSGLIQGAAVIVHGAEELASAKRAVLGMAKDMEQAFQDHGKLNALYVGALGEIQKLKDMLASVPVVPPPTSPVPDAPAHAQEPTDAPPSQPSKLKVPLAQPAVKK